MSPLHKKREEILKKIEDLKLAQAKEGKGGKKQKKKDAVEPKPAEESAEPKVAKAAE